MYMSCRLVSLYTVHPMVSYRSDLAVPWSRVEMALKITDFPGLLRYPVKAYRLVMGMSAIQQAFVRFHACRDILSFCIVYMEDSKRERNNSDICPKTLEGLKHFCSPSSSGTFIIKRP